MNVHGKQLIRIYEHKNQLADIMEKQIMQAIKNRDKLRYRELIAEFKRMFLVEEISVQNKVVLAGRSIIANRLGGTNDYTLNITHGALGTSTTTPADGDTTLGAEIYREAYADADVSQASDGIVIMSFFYSKSSFENANVNEFGTVIDGTASADTGELFSHVVFSSTIDKTLQKSITVDAQYTIT